MEASCRVESSDIASNSRNGAEEALLHLKRAPSDAVTRTISGSTLPYLWMIVGTFAFAVMATLAHVLGPVCDWRVIASARAFLALVFAAGLAKLAGANLVIIGSRTLWMRSLAGSVSLVLTFFALTRLPVSDVLTVTNMYPIWVALLAWPMLKERPTAAVWLSIVSSVVGVALIQQPHFAEGNFATLVALVSSVFTAIAMLGLHQLTDIDDRAIVAHFSGVAFLFCLASGWLYPEPLSLTGAFETRPLLLLFGVGLSATVGQLFLTRAFSAGSPSKVSVVGLTQVVFAMIFEFMLGRESFNALTLAGIGFVLVPTAWLMSRRSAEVP